MCADLAHLARVRGAAWAGWFTLAMLCLCHAIPVRAQVYTSPGAWSYTVPSGITRVAVEVAGAGGGGGGADGGGPGGTGSTGVSITAVVAVSAGQVLSGTIGRGGETGWTAGSLLYPYGAPCTGGGAGGSGGASGGNGGNTNCPGSGYSGGGGGGGGSTTLALAGTVLFHAGGGGGGGGGSLNAPGGAGQTALSFASTTSCGSASSGVSAANYNGDGGGGGGGGGGYSTGSAGTGQPDGTSATGGNRGGSCRNTSVAIIGASISGLGGTGGAGVSSAAVRSYTYGGNGYVTISTISVQVATSTAPVSDPVNGAGNPKLIPGAVVRHSIQVSNYGTSALDSNAVLLIDSLPSQLQVGTASSPVFSQGSPSSTLSFSSATDIRYSNAASAPSSFSACTYSPISAYDPAVTFVCLNPKGSMAGSSGTPTSFTISLQTQVK